MQKSKNRPLKLVLGFLAAVDVFVWYLILFSAATPQGGAALYFLNVGQGDASLAILPGGIKALIDAGPANSLAKKNLEEILPVNDRYIDLVLISHPQIDHMGGLIDILKNYKIGAIITNGGNSDSAVWQELLKVIQEKKIPQIVLAADDKIKSKDFEFDILSPSSDLSASVNEFGLVELLNINGVKSLFTADIGAKTERYLANKYNLDVDILKVSHHGSKYSSDADFLKSVTPSISVIEVGKNSYGHPTPEVLGRLKEIGSRIFRTDKDGLIKIEINEGRLKIYFHRR